MHAVIYAVVITIPFIKAGGMLVYQPTPPSGGVVIAFHIARVEIEHVFLVFPKRFPNAFRFKQGAVGIAHHGKRTEVYEAKGKHDKGKPCYAARNSKLYKEACNA